MLSQENKTVVTVSYIAHQVELTPENVILKQLELEVMCAHTYYSECWFMDLNCHSVF